MRRRDFIALVGAAAAWPLAARAQRPMPVIGFLASVSATEWSDRVAAFRVGLGERGFVEGQNVTVEYLWADNDLDKLPKLAADLVSRKVSVIVAPGSPLAATAAKSATATIPIVFNNAADPVKLGLVTSLNRPGGNATGVTNMGAELGTKRLGLLRDIAPKVAGVALLINPTNPSAEVQTLEIQEAAQRVGQQLFVVNASSEKDIDTAFETVLKDKGFALIVTSDAFFVSQRNRLAGMASRFSVPAIYEFREFAAAGGLMSYGTNITDLYRLMGVYAGRILQGEKPADLPVMRPTKFELVINLKTAKALGLTVPPGLLAAADEVIE
jgi:putative ABC transport system substrate-binding protein